MYCTKCGFKLNNNANFCPQCGATTSKSTPSAPINSTPSSDIAPSPNITPSQQSNAPQPQSSKTPALPICAISIAGAGFLLFIFSWAKPGFDATSSSSSVTALQGASSLSLLMIIASFILSIVALVQARKKITDKSKQRLATILSAIALALSLIPLIIITISLILLLGGITLFFLGA